MREFRPENSEKSTEYGVSFMTAVAEAGFLLRRIAEPRPVCDSVKAAITRAARAVGLPFGRAEDIWRGEARTVRAEEMDAIRRAASRKNKEKADRDEYAVLMERLSFLEDRLEQIDPDFHRPAVAGLRALSAPMGGKDRAVVDGEG